MNLNTPFRNLPGYTDQEWLNDATPRLVGAVVEIGEQIDITLEIELDPISGLNAKIECSAVHHDYVLPSQVLKEDGITALRIQAGARIHLEVDIGEDRYIDLACDKITFPYTA